LQDWPLLMQARLMSRFLLGELPSYPHYLPPVEHWLARELAARLYALRITRPDLGLGPDGKVIVTIREDGTRWSLDSFSCSLQQLNAADDVALHRAVRLLVEERLAELATALPGLSPRLPDELCVNGAGAFEVGGPEGDNGLSGKKLVADAYGPRVPIGGGAWSGKDFFKADRAGGLHARRLAKLVVKLGLAQEAQVTLGWFPGDTAARLIRVATDKGDIDIAGPLAEMVDLTLARSGTQFSQPGNLVEIARWGHFNGESLPWERVGRL